MIRPAIGLLVMAAIAAPAAAQPVTLSEKVALGDQATYAISLELTGNLVVAAETGKQPIPLEAVAKHRLTERVLAVSEGLPTATARHYAEAAATARVGSDKMVRALPTDRRLIIARGGPEGRICFAAGGPLSRDELDLVTDHFNPQCLPGLLPGKAVNVGDTWSLPAAAVQSACAFDITTKAALTGKLTGVKDGVATFTIEGTAQGIEAGARVSLGVSATGSFDVAAGRITALTWNQKDEREQGPVSPASRIDAKVTVTREATAEVKELADDALAALASGPAPATLLAVKQSDAKGRYQLVHSRDWHVTGQTDAHLVLRLVDRGDFVAQATITVWNKVEPGKHTPVEEFKKAVASAPGWTPGKVLFDRELPAPAGRWLHRLTTDGKMDDVAVVQSYYFLTGPQGEQVVVTVAAKPEKLKALGTRDLELVSAIQFGGR
jgi:hypothetical protein